MKRHVPILLIILVYLLVGSLYALYTPDWQAPDEPAHYNVVRQFAAGAFPVIEASDYDQAFQGAAISSGFAANYDVPDRYFSYEDWQPPLYYLLLVPVYGLFDGALEPLRLASLLLGAGVVFLTYRVALLVLQRETWAWLAAAFVAFLPQHLAIMASVNNDALAELVIAAVLYVLIRNSEKLSPQSSALIPQPSLLTPRHLVTLGFLLGLGLITKGSVYIMAPVVGLVLLRRYWGEWGQVVKAGVWVGGAAASIALPWWLRNSVVYGGLDIIAWQAHGEVVVGQPRTVEWFEQFGVWGTLQRFFTTTFHSFWGQFGWMGVVMPPWVYQILLLFTLLVLAGLTVSLLKRDSSFFIIHHSSLILPLTLAFTILLYLGYNFTFVQHQGRYLFPALIPIACGVAVGLGTVWEKGWELVGTQGNSEELAHAQTPPLVNSRTTHPCPERSRSNALHIVYHALLPLGLIIALVGLDLFALFRFILPQLGRG